MPKKYQNKYRIESNRMPLWDYAGNGLYFITLVAEDRKPWFGEIHSGKMHLSEFGNILNLEWLKSFEIRDELILDEYIIMPNHLHAIVSYEMMHGPSKNGRTNDSRDSHESHESRVDTHGRAYLRDGDGNHDGCENCNGNRDIKHDGDNRGITNNPQFHRKPKSISSFVAGFKSATTNKIDDYIDENKLAIPKFNRKNRLWQPNYHDRVIRNESEYYRIRKYIIENPENWKEAIR